jgi:hypothetical protein
MLKDTYFWNFYRRKNFKIVKNIKCFCNDVSANARAFGISPNGKNVSTSLIGWKLEASKMRDREPWWKQLCK